MKDTTLITPDTINFLWVRPSPSIYCGSANGPVCLLSLLLISPLLALPQQRLLPNDGSEPAPRRRQHWVGEGVLTGQGPMSLFA